MALSVDDLNSGFAELPEYGGLLPVEIKFKKVSSLCIDVMQLEFRIYDIEVTDFNNVVISLSPGGVLKFHCEAIEVDYGNGDK